jgi:hypothetical protein
MFPCEYMIFLGQHFFSYYSFLIYTELGHIHDLYLFKPNIAHIIGEPKIVSTDAPSRFGCVKYIFTDPELET